MVKKQLIAGNWKMNGTIKDAECFLNSLLAHNFCTHNEILICPPFNLLYLFKLKLQDSNIMLGAQDCHFEQKGAFTGDISSLMLKDMCCKYVIIGHSERRNKHYETNYLINKKAMAVLNADLIPIICVGETQSEKNDGKTSEIISKQVNFSIPRNFNSDNVVIAYEPVWAIGSGKIPTTEEIISAIKAIRTTIASLSNEAVAKNIKILYGGSVNSSNAKEILSLEEVDGALVGGASLNAEEFSNIINNSKI